MSENKMRTHGSDLESLEILDLLLMLKNLLPDHAGLCSVTVVARRVRHLSRSAASLNGMKVGPTGFWFPTPSEYIPGERASVLRKVGYIMMTVSFYRIRIRGLRPR